jgi:hypothetical protein
MFQVVYLSTATQEYGQEELTRILEVSRRNNQADGVTGMLCYHGGTFFQMLEGKREKVQAVMDRVARDPRHHGITILLEQEITERHMPDWSMAFREMTPADADRLEGFDRALRGDGKSRLDSIEAESEALVLLQSFQETSQGRLGGRL